MPRDDWYHPFKGLQHLIGRSDILPVSIKRSAQAVLDRIAEGLERLHNAFQPKPGEDLNSPAYVQRLTTEIIFELSRMDAEAKLQRTELSVKGEPHPGQIEIAIYGLSGIREQLDAIADRYEAAVALAKQQSPVGGIQVGTSPRRPQDVPPHEHPPTLVNPNEKPRVGFWGRVFGPHASPDGNAGLKQRLIAVFTEFSQNTEALERAFQIAQPRSLEQLRPAIDMLRGSAIWLHDREASFYRVVQSGL